ncbi:MAG: cysteine--tRNA ligase, partial [Bacteroidia bacterium]|nr:cysteine--tRNA ligase [Bacteroidia bacterium]
NNTRELEGQQEKKGRLDFALWIKAKPEHLMQWPSPWGNGFPGWHIECSAMSTKYLGEQFDIHGGGMDLVPTHHTNEIAQNFGYCGKHPANYWLHTNMLTVDGVKMSKSLGNSFLPHELFSGTSILKQGFSPMTVRFFMMQTHYSSTLDFSKDALVASEKGFNRLMESVKTLQKLEAEKTSTVNIPELVNNCYAAMNDDFNTPVLVAHLFDAVRIINSANDKKEKLSAKDLEDLKKLYKDFIFDVMGLKGEEESGKTLVVLDNVLKFVLEMRQNAKSNKDFATSDKIRDYLTGNGIQIKDGKEGTTWSLEN